MGFFIRIARRLEALDDRDVRLTAALAHRLEAVAAARALKLVEHRHHELRAGCAEGMAEGDRAAVRVPLRHIRMKLLLPREDDGREGLVDLDMVKVRDLHPC